jgi:predicted Zn-dependent protease
VADNPRIEELRRRVREEPASIAFAQLAEELRRAAQYLEAVEVCRSGLEMYPGYLSVHVTLGRCLVELDRLDEAEQELERVRESAPDNLAAIRALSKIQERRGVVAGPRSGGAGAPSGAVVLLKPAVTEATKSDSPPVSAPARAPQRARSRRI